MIGKKRKRQNVVLGNMNSGFRNYCWFSVLWFAMMILVLMENRYQREEAKIQAWVNLQNAKAEAQSRKLEVNLYCFLFFCFYYLSFLSVGQ